jgi:hypothetical protein
MAETTLSKNDDGGVRPRRTPGHRETMTEMILEA